jgi:hypothetical protein
MAKRTVTITFIILLTASFITAEVINLSNSGPDSFWPGMAVNKDGVVLVVWTEGTSGGNQLYYVVYKDNLWSYPKSTKLMRDNSEIAQLAADKDGNFHLSFSDGNSSHTREIFYSQYTTAQDKWSGRQLVYHSSDNSAWNRIDVEDETIYVMWYHEHGPPYEADIILNTKQIGGSWRQQREDVSQDANKTAIHPAFKVLNGNIYACYMQNISAPDTPFWRIYFSEKYNGIWKHPKDVGGTNWPHMTAEDTNGSGQPANVHCIFPKKDGNFYITSRINGTWIPEYSLNTTYAPPGFGDIKFTSNTLVVAFAQNSLIGPGFSMFIRKKVFTNGSWGAWEIPIEVTEGSVAEYPQIGFNNFGYVHIIWQDGGEGRNDIYWKKIKIYDAPPFITLDTETLSYTGEEYGSNPPSQKFKIKNGGSDTLNYTMSADKTWISISPASGSSTGEEDEITVSVDIIGLTEGVHTGTITVSSSKASNSPQTIAVSVILSPPHIFAPQNFNGEKIENISLLSKEIIHRLTWEPDSRNHQIVKYLLYEVIRGVPVLLTEFNSSVLTYVRRNVQGSQTYRIVAQDERERTGETAEVIIN